MFSSSRGLAQITSILELADRMPTAVDINGAGSRPVSAIRPANIEMKADAPPDKAPANSRTCSKVNTAVTLTFTPEFERTLTNSIDDCRFVFVTGIFTYTLSAH